MGKVFTLGSPHHCVSKFRKKFLDSPSQVTPDWPATLMWLEWSRQYCTGIRLRSWLVNRCVGQINGCLTEFLRHFIIPQLITWEQLHSVQQSEVLLQLCVDLDFSCSLFHSDCISSFSELIPIQDPWVSPLSFKRTTKYRCSAVSVLFSVYFLVWVNFRQKQKPEDAFLQTGFLC